MAAGKGECFAVGGNTELVSMHFLPVKENRAARLHFIFGCNVPAIPSKKVVVCINQFITNITAGFTKRLKLKEGSVHHSSADDDIRTCLENHLHVATFSTTSNATFSTTSNATISTTSNATFSTTSNATISTTSNATFSTNSNATFSTNSNATFSTNSNATFSTNSNATISTNSNATFSTNSNATFSTTSNATFSTNSNATFSTTSNATFSTTSNATFSTTSNATISTTSNGSIHGSIKALWDQTRVAVQLLLKDLDFDIHLAVGTTEFLFNVAMSGPIPFVLAMGLWAFGPFQFGVFRFNFPRLSWTNRTIRVNFPGTIRIQRD